MTIVRRVVLAAFAAAAAFPAAMLAARPRPQICQKAIDTPHSQWGKHLKHVMHDAKTDEVTWTLQNGATITYGSDPVPKARIVGEAPKGFPLNTLGKLSGNIRMSCQRHGRIMLAGALMLCAGSALAQSPHQYNPPNRPWSVALDGFTYLHQLNELANSPLTTHQLHWHWVAKLSRYQAHESYLELLQSEFPQNQSEHSLDISIGGIPIFRNYDQNNQWDGTWTEICGPNDITQRYLPCRSYMAVAICADVACQNGVNLWSPWVAVFDGDPDSGKCFGLSQQVGNCWHSYDLWVDTDDNGQLYVEWAVDNILVTANYNGENDTGDNVFNLSDQGTYKGPVYFPVDAMYWRQYNDNVENLYQGEYDQTSPVVEVAEHFLATNMVVPPDPVIEISNETFTWLDYNGIFHPSNLGPGASYPYGYAAEIFNIGDYLWYPIGTAPQAWSVQGYGSTEPYNQGYVGGQLTNGTDDPF